jgi:hypothetical protein
MDTAVATGLNVVRAWGHSVSPEYALQTAPGQYSEAIFRGLDYAVEQARRRGIKASFSVSSSQAVTSMLSHTFHIFPAPRQGALADRLHVKAAQMLDEDFVEFQYRMPLPTRYSTRPTNPPKGHDEQSTIMILLTGVAACGAETHANSSPLCTNSSRCSHVDHIRPQAT